MKVNYQYPSAYLLGEISGAHGIEDAWNAGVAERRDHSLVDSGVDTSKVIKQSVSHDCEVLPLTAHENRETR